MISPHSQYFFNCIVAPFVILVCIFFLPFNCLTSFCENFPLEVKALACTLYCIQLPHDLHSYQKKIIKKIDKCILNNSYICGQ